MILGRFAWRGGPVEAESISSPAGEVVWLHRLMPERIGIGVVSGDRLALTRHAPADDTALLELEAAYRQFRESLARELP